MDGTREEGHKFQAPSGMTYEQVFTFAIREFLVPLVKGLAEELGPEQFLPVLEKVAMAVGADGGRQMAQRAQPNDLAAFTSWVREPDRYSDHILSFDVIEDTKDAVEVRITECLFAHTFRAEGAGELGYSIICRPDFGLCQAFNPAIRLQRTRTLMQGHGCCDHRWVWEG